MFTHPEGSMKKRTCNTLLRFAMSFLAVMIAWVMAPGARSWAGELAPIPLESSPLTAHPRFRTSL